MLFLVGMDTCTIYNNIFVLLNRTIIFDVKKSLVNIDTFATHLHLVNFLVRLILPSRI